MDSHRYAGESNQRALRRGDTPTSQPLGPAQARRLLRRRLELILGGRIPSPPHISRLDHALSAKRYAAGDVIAREGASEDLLAVVAEGQITVLPPPTHNSRAPQEHEEPAIILHPGSIFGEKMLLEGEPSERTMLAATDVELLTIHRNDLASIVAQQRPELTPRVPTHLLGALGETAVPLLLRGSERLVSVAALVVALVFIVALLMDLGR